MDWAPVIQAVSGGALVLLGGFAQYWNLMRVEQRKDQRALRDKKVERLRRAYVDVVYAAQKLQHVAVQVRFQSGSETAEARYERLNTYTADAQDRLERATANLRLEDGSDQVIQLSKDLLAYFNSYIWDWNVTAHRSRTEAEFAAATPRSMGESLTKLVETVNHLEAYARTHLAELETVI